MVIERIAISFKMNVVMSLPHKIFLYFTILLCIKELKYKLFNEYVWVIIVLSFLGKRWGYEGNI